MDINDFIDYIDRMIADAGLPEKLGDIWHDDLVFLYKSVRTKAVSDILDNSKRGK